MKQDFTVQHCPKGVHPDWFVNGTGTYACPWCTLHEAALAGLEFLELVEEVAEDCDEETSNRLHRIMDRRVEPRE